MKNIERLNLRGNADLTDDCLHTLKTLHKDGCFSSRRAYINLEEVGINFTKKENRPLIASLEDAGINLDYREGNTFPAADADTGEQAAPFTMVDRNGDPVSFDMLKGAYIYIQISTEWCGFCHRQAEYLELFHNELDAKGVRENFVSVVILADESDRESVQASWEKQYDFDYVVIPRQGEGIPDYHLGGYPSMTLVLPNGNIAKITIV